LLIKYCVILYIRNKDKVTNILRYCDIRLPERRGWILIKIACIIKPFSEKISSSYGKTKKNNISSLSI
jgi:hypothetical protein